MMTFLSAVLLPVLGSSDAREFDVSRMACVCVASIAGQVTDESVSSDHSKDDQDEPRVTLKAASNGDGVGAEDRFNVPSRVTLQVLGVITKSCDSGAPHWFAFVGRDGLIWPRLELRETDLPQDVQTRIAVPADFEDGKLVVVCVAPESDQTFRRWLDQGRDTPLNVPDDAEVVLAVSLTVK